MPAITAINSRAEAQTDFTPVTLDGSTDTFTPNPAFQQSLLLINTTGAPVTITMIGADAPADFACSGHGRVTTTPVSVTVPASGHTMKYINFVGATLAGEVTISNGVGLDAALINL